MIPFFLTMPISSMMSTLDAKRDQGMTAEEAIHRACVLRFRLRRPRPST
jgi:hypothetical protein